jgi:hypothetical protein
MSVVTWVVAVANVGLISGAALGLANRAIEIQVVGIAAVRCAVAMLVMAPVYMWMLMRFADVRAAALLLSVRNAGVVAVVVAAIMFSYVTVVNAGSGVVGAAGALAVGAAASVLGGGIAAVTVDARVRGCAAAMYSRVWSRAR